MERVWLSQYSEGVPSDIDPNQYTSIIDIFEQSVEKYSDKPAFSNLGKTLTYAELDVLARDFAAYLQQELKLEPGTSVAIMSPNFLFYPVALFGILRAGYKVVNVNPLYTPRELRHQVIDADVKAIVILENFAHTLEEVIELSSIKHVILARCGELQSPVKKMLVNFVVKYIKKMVPKYQLKHYTLFADALDRGAELEFAPVTLSHDDIAFLQYTGGTTGVAKGAILTHGNMVANVLQAGAVLSVIAQEGEETIITALPLYHIFSLLANCLVFMHFGAHNILITNPKDLPEFVNILKQNPFTAITGVNTLFNALLNTPGFNEIDFSNLRLTLGGGMAVQHAVAQAWKKATGCALLEAYGLTETSPAVCMNPLDAADYNGTIGLPIPSTEISIRDDAGNELDFNQPGELWVKGPQVMRGYWGQEQATAESITDGWFHTGDIAQVDEKGFVKIVDRKKDMILVSGFNVYPNEIEDVMAEHPGILEVAAVGVPHERSGEAVKLYIVLKNKSLTIRDVEAYCKEQLTGYKRPKVIEFRDELPKSNVGKILRRVLKDENTEVLKDV